MNQKKHSKLAPVEIGLKADTRSKICKILATVLADQHVLYIKKRNFHWNLIGERFHTLHVFYEEQYGALEASIDATAERIRQLGGTAPGSMAEFLGAATLGESSGALIHGEASIEALVGDHETVIQALRDDISKVEDLGDAGTAEFLTGLLQGHEQMAWMLRSFLR